MSVPSIEKSIRWSSQYWGLTPLWDAIVAAIPPRRDYEPDDFPPTIEKNWLRGLDLNQRPSGYEPDELPGCSTPRTGDLTRREGA